MLGSLFGMGKRKRAARRDIWKDLRSLAYFGLCDCERLLANLDSAIGYCQRSLAYNQTDPYAHFALGVAYMRKANATNSLAELDPALKHLNAVVSINPDLEQAVLARKNIAVIQQALGTR